jgi:hypothetical protein
VRLDNWTCFAVAVILVLGFGLAGWLVTFIDLFARLLAAWHWVLPG